MLRFLRVVTVKSSEYLKWIHFENDRPWVDRESPITDITVQLVGDGTGSFEIVLLDRNDRKIQYEQLTAAVPPGRRAFLNRKNANRNLFRLAFDFPSQGTVRILAKDSLKLLGELKPRPVFPEFLHSFLLDHHSGTKQSAFRNFIETGTLFGHTTLFASYWFQNVVTIELSEELYRDADQAFKHIENISCLNGNSAEVLSGLLLDVSGATCFLLDAHWSGDSTVDWADSEWKGYPVDTAKLEIEGASECQKQVPLLKELHAISKLHKGRAAVIIDDWQSIGSVGAGFPGEDWSEIGLHDLKTYISNNSRTEDHFVLDEKHYVWILMPKN